MLKHTMMPLLAAALVWGCNGAGGEPGPGGTGSVVGSVSGQGFDYTPAQVGSIFKEIVPGEGELSIYLCEGDCGTQARADAEPARAVTLVVRGLTAELRGGTTFRIGEGATAYAQFRNAGRTVVETATGGEVAIESTDIQPGGQSVGTFQLEFGSGSFIGGFFEAPLREVDGSVVVLGRAH